MKCNAATRSSRAPGQSGYALLFAVFLAATMFVFAAAAAPGILNQGRRQREEELIWRGNQYVRAIRLFYQKNGRLPQNKDELVKGSLSVHFLRKTFTDPMNSSSGDWRFIYANPSGQLIGSVRYHTLQEMAIQQGANSQTMAQFAALFGGAPAGQTQPAGSAAGARGGPLGAASAAAGRGGPAGPGGIGDAGRGGADAGASGTAGAQTGSSAPSDSATASSSGAFGQPAAVPLQPVDGPVLGASLIGIASKVKRDSLLVYQGKENYFQWEFIWNPLLTRGPGGIAAPPGLPAGIAGAPQATPGIAAPGALAPGNGLPGSPGFPGAAGQQTGPPQGQFPAPPAGRGGSGIPMFPPNIMR